MSYNIAYNNSDGGNSHDDDENAEVPGYDGLTRKELNEKVLWRTHDFTEEWRTLQDCLDNGYVEIEPGVYGNPIQKELPESMKRYLSSVGVGAQYQRAGTTSTTATSETSNAYSSDEDGAGIMMQIHPQSDMNVSLREALSALRYCKRIFDNAREENQPWQHPKELLDATAGALDEAGLAMRSHTNKQVAMSLSSEKESPESEAANKKIIEEIKELSIIVKKERQSLIETAAKAKTAAETVSSSSSKPEKNNKTLLVYASQTGTSKKFAKMLQDSIDGDHLDVRNLKNITILDLIKRKRVYFITSTFGLGRPPRSAEVFFTSLQLQDATSGYGFNNEHYYNKPLRGVEIGVAAFGNSDFNDFANFGKTLHQELLVLGATPILKLSTMDVKHGEQVQQDEFHKWKLQVIQLEEEKQEKEMLSSSNSNNSGMNNNNNMKSDIDKEKKQETSPLSSSSTAVTNHQSSSCCIIL